MRHHRSGVNVNDISSLEDETIPMLWSIIKIHKEFEQDSICDSNIPNII